MTLLPFFDPNNIDKERWEPKLSHSKAIAWCREDYNQEKDSGTWLAMNITRITNVLLMTQDGMSKCEVLSLNANKLKVLLEWCNNNRDLIMFCCRVPMFSRPMFADMGLYVTLKDFLIMCALLV